MHWKVLVVLVVLVVVVVVGQYTSLLGPAAPGSRMITVAGPLQRSLAVESAGIAPVVAKVTCIEQVCWPMNFLSKLFSNGDHCQLEL